MTNSLSNVVKISELGAATQCGSHSACRFSSNIEHIGHVRLHVLESKC